MSDLLEVVVAFACFSGIDELPMSEEHELVDQGHNVAAGWWMVKTTVRL